MQLGSGAGHASRRKRVSEGGGRRYNGKSFNVQRHKEWHRQLIRVGEKTGKKIDSAFVQSIVKEEVVLEEKAKKRAGVGGGGGGLH